MIYVKNNGSVYVHIIMVIIWQMWKWLRKAVLLAQAVKLLAAERGLEADCMTPRPGLFQEPLQQCLSLGAIDVLGWTFCCGSYPGMFNNVSDLFALHAGCNPLSPFEPSNYLFNYPLPDQDSGDHQGSGQLGSWKLSGACPVSGMTCDSVLLGLEWSWHHGHETGYEWG